MSVAWARGLAIVLLCAAGAARAGSGVSVAEAGLSSAGSGDARLTLQLSGTLTPRLFRLENPDRVVLDLPGTRLAPGVRLPGGEGPVRGLRSGVQPGNTLRLVLETSAPLTGKAKLIGTQPPYRLEVELHAAGPAGAQDRVAKAARKSAPPAPGSKATGAVAPPTSASASSSASAAEPAAPVADEAVAAPVAVPVRSVRSAGEGRDIIVAIDAGHGGQDPGATGRSGTREKDVVLGIARALARRIDAEPGMRAYLTRSNDTFIPLRERINLARAARADIFVSVHADSIANREVSGSSVYVLSDKGASSEAARWLAERENAADLKGGVSLAEQGSLASVLMDLSQSASIGSSMEAAEKVLTYMDRVGEVRKTRVQQAGFVVLKSPDIPSMLVETAYISNPAEEQRLRTGQHQERIAEAIFSGVREYFRASPPDGTLFAQRKGRGGAATPIMAVNAGG